MLHSKRVRWLAGAREFKPFLLPTRKCLHPFHSYFQSLSQMKKHSQYVLLSMVLILSLSTASWAKGNPDKFILYNVTTFEVNIGKTKGKEDKIEIDWWINRQRLSRQPRLDLRHQAVPLSINRAIQLANGYLRTQPNYSQYHRLNTVVLQPIDGRSEADYWAEKEAIWTGRYCYEISFAKKGESLPTVVIILLDGTVVKPIKTIVRDTE
jgi:hypothetical protein